MKFILGKKLNMAQVFQPDGKVAPVTRIQAGPCLITGKMTVEKNGYTAVQCAFQEKKKVNRALRGFFAKLGGQNYGVVREFRLSADDPMNDKLKIGDQVVAGMFAVGDEIAVVGTSKGKGFQGVVKRHHFHGGKKTHGHKDQLRMPGSVGATGPAHVMKGLRMGGRMGGEQVTVSGLRILAIDNDVITVKGAVPGARNGLLMIKTPGELDLSAMPAAADIEIAKKVDNEPIVESVPAAENVPVKSENQPVNDNSPVEPAAVKAEK